MYIARFILHNAFNVLVTASAIPAFLWMLEFREELRLSIRQIILLLAGLFMVGLVTVYGAAALQNLIAGYHWANRCGWPVFVTMPLYCLLLAKLTKRELIPVSDIMCIPIMLIFGFGRAACIYQGCCIGDFIPGTSYRWPLVIFEVLFIIVFACVCGKKTYARRFNGRSYPIFLIGYGAFRLLLEQFRYIHDGGALGCIILFILGVIWLLGLHRSQKNT